MQRFVQFQYKEVLTVYIDEQDIPNNVAKEYFKKPINENSWTDNEEKKEGQQVKYTPDQLFARANLFIKLVPPDKFEAMDKVWMGLVFAIKIKYLKALKLDMRSHYSIKRMCQFILNKTINNKFHRIRFIMTFNRAENLHSQHYGTILIKDQDLEQIFINIENLKNHIQGVDEQKLVDAYNTSVIADIEFRDAMKSYVGMVNLAGNEYDYDKTAHFTQRN